MRRCIYRFFSIALAALPRAAVAEIAGFDALAAPRHAQLIELLEVRRLTVITISTLTGLGDQPDCILIKEAVTGIVNRSLEFGVATGLMYRIAMKRDEAIIRLKQHEADLKRLGVEHLYMSVQPRVARRRTISTSICFSITKRESSASLN